MSFTTTQLLRIAYDLASVANDSHLEEVFSMSIPPDEDEAGYEGSMPTFEFMELLAKHIKELEAT